MKLKTIKEVFAALGRGETVQSRWILDSTWVDTVTSGFWRFSAFDSYEWRIKPRPVPPGDLTWEEAQAHIDAGRDVERWNPHEDDCWYPAVGPRKNRSERCAYRLKPQPKLVHGTIIGVDIVIKRWDEGKRDMQWSYPVGWPQWERLTVRPLPQDKSFMFRIAPSQPERSADPAPTKKLVPLEAKDVPPGSAVRMDGWAEHRWAPCAPQANVICILGEGLYSYEKLKNEGWIISRDFGKTWVKCEKEVEE